MKILQNSLLFLSLCLNAFLGWQVYIWNTAWAEQFITTSEIETIFKLADHKLTYDEALAIAKNKYQGSYKLLDKSENTRMIEVSGTQLIFEKNEYIGSKANLPKKGLWQN